MQSKATSPYTGEAFCIPIVCKIINFHYLLFIIFYKLTKHPYYPTKIPYNNSEVKFVKILVILTGGTIGSKLSDNIIDVDDPFNINLLSLYKQRYGNDTDFEVTTPLNILSENMNTDIWQSLLYTLYNVNTENYDGIIITHGSDTLSYTSSILGIALCGVKIPVVLVASNYVLTDSRANGVDNFFGAVEFVRQSSMSGVFVSYKNDDVCEIYLSTRIVKADCYLDKFKSFDGEPLCKVENKKLIMNKKIPTNGRENENIIINNSFENKVALISPYPSIDYNMYHFDKSVKAVLHLTYHSGTACAKGENNVLEFIKMCRKQGIDVYFSSLKKNTALYDTALEMLRAGGKPLYNISEESAFAKLLLCYNQDKTDTDKFLQKNYFYESID